MQPVECATRDQSASFSIFGQCKQAHEACSAIFLVHLNRCSCANAPARIMVAARGVLIGDVLTEAQLAMVGRFHLCQQGKKDLQKNCKRGEGSDQGDMLIIVGNGWLHCCGEKRNEGTERQEEID